MQIYKYLCFFRVIDCYIFPCFLKKIKISSSFAISAYHYKILFWGIFVLFVDFVMKMSGCTTCAQVIQSRANHFLNASESSFVNSADPLMGKNLSINSLHDVARSRERRRVRPSLVRYCERKPLTSMPETA